MANEKLSLMFQKSFLLSWIAASLMLKTSKLKFRKYHGGGSGRKYGRARNTDNTTSQETKKDAILQTEILAHFSIEKCP